MRGRVWTVALCFVLACSGEIGRSGRSSDTGGPGSSSDPSNASNTQAFASAIPRLSRREIETTIQDVFGLSGLALSALPPDPDIAINPETNGEETIFDTFAGTLGEYVPSEVFVQGMSTLAFDVANQASADRARIDALSGCEPIAAEDAACMAAFIEKVGLRLYRRPLEADERSRLEALALEFTGEGGFYLGARAVVQSLVQSPEFVYQSEIGSEPEDGLHKLSNFELVSRLSFLFWGAPPTSGLLDQAAGSDFTDRELQDIVQSMAADARTDLQIRRMHTMWLRYEDALVTDSELRTHLLTETDALLDRVISDPTRPWSELFTSTKTYASPRLASHYQMAQEPDAATWINYENPERAGVLSHGSFLSLSSTKGNETLPSRRGAMIARQVLCRTIPPPPPDVDIDDGVEVAEGACKSDAYDAHRGAGSACEGCHSLIDPIGFGFERFDGLGVYRTVERDNASCSIAGLGSERGQAFSGPRGFVDLAMQSGDLTQCGTEQLMRFALRRRLDPDDQSLSEHLHSSFLDSGEDFRTLMVELALDSSFRYRRETP